MYYALQSGVVVNQDILGRRIFSLDLPYAFILQIDGRMNGRKSRYCYVSPQSTPLSVDDDNVDNGACGNNSTSQHCRPHIYILIIKMRERKNNLRRRRY